VNNLLKVINKLFDLWLTVLLLVVYDLFLIFKLLPIPDQVRNLFKYYEFDASI